MPKSTICGCFFFKASHAQELVEVKTAQLILVEVVKILQLTGQQFQNFSANLLQDMPFLIPNKHLTGYDKGVTRCLLVTTRGRRDGILVDCQGYNYARYSCYVPEKRSLDLRDVPVDHYDLKLRQPGASGSGDDFLFERAGAARPFQSTYRLERSPAAGGAEADTAPWAVSAQA